MLKKMMIGLVVLGTIAVTALLLHDAQVSTVAGTVSNLVATAIGVG
jgi:hypothetical protein